MRLPFADSVRSLARPGNAFTAPTPALGRAVADMARVWMPLALLNAAMTTLRGLRLYDDLRRGGMPPWLLGWLGADPGDLRSLLSSLPPPPAFGSLLPWLCLLVPLGVLGAWLHHAVWDHMGLWLLGGLKGKRGFRTTLVAEAEALRIAALGTLVGLLGFLPYLGVLLALPLLLLDGYLWLFRGVALAARHGCDTWRGVAATAVHALLLGCWALGLLVLLGILVRVGA